MTCQRSGRSPTIAIGFGALLTPSRIRIPRPPQNRTTFTARSPPQSDDVELRNGVDQAAAPGTDVLQLLADLLAEIPRQHQDVVGPGLLDALRRVDRDVR